MPPKRLKHAGVESGINLLIVVGGRLVCANDAALLRNRKAKTPKRNFFM
jgi:hypothetical protein